MRFEKWQALGNDYVIVEQSDLPFEMTPRPVQIICAPHTGVGSDGVLLLSEHLGLLGWAHVHVLRWAVRDPLRYWWAWGLLGFGVYTHRHQIRRIPELS